MRTGRRACPVLIVVSSRGVNDDRAAGRLRGRPRDDRRRRRRRCGACRTDGLRVRRLHARTSRAAVGRPSAYDRRSRTGAAGRWARRHPVRPARRRHGPFRGVSRGAGSARRLHESHAIDSRGRSSEPAGRRRSGRRERRRVACGARRGPAVRTGPVESERMYDRRQRRRELRRPAHAEVRRHHEPPARRRAGAPRSCASRWASPSPTSARSPSSWCSPTARSWSSGTVSTTTRSATT